MPDDDAIAEVPTLHKPNPALIVELENMLAAARVGTLRGMLFTTFSQGSNNYRWGSLGDCSLPEFAMGLKLMELEFDSIVTRGEED